MNVLFKVITLCLLLEIADGLLCYQCADSSSDDGRNQCQSYVRTMKYYRRKFLETGRPQKYVKNCTNFGGLPSDRVYCVISTVEIGGSYKYFNRGCTDSVNFFGKEYDDLFRGLAPDNQTTCKHNDQNYLGCVTMCASDFCNGPVSTSGLVPMLHPVLTFMFIATLMFAFNRC